jgi:lysophospholipase L1-like esterase
MALLPQMTIKATDKVVVCGDSITAATWYRDLITMSGAGTDIGNSPGRGGYYKHADPAPPSGNWINSGVGGNVAGDIAAAVAARISNYAAQCLILEVGINDVLLSVSDATFSTNYNSIGDQALAAQPSLKIICVPIFMDGEDTPNIADANVNAKNAIIAATAARIGGTYADVRTPAVAWEVANNPGHAFSGFLTDDGVHPSTPLGKLMFSTWVRPYIIFQR